jgi:hypothetical protein
LTAGAAALRADFEGPDGWRAAISKEVNRVFVQFAAIKLVPISDYYEALAHYPDQVSLGHVMLAFRAKVKPDGTHDVNKAHIAIADKADAVWACRYDRFLTGYDLVATAYDPRCFVQCSPRGVLYVQIHVDDTLVTASSRELCDAFVTAWALEFHEVADTSELSEDFVGVRTHRVSDRSVALTCGATIDNLAALVREYPVAPGV